MTIKINERFTMSPATVVFSMSSDEVPLPSWDDLAKEIHANNVAKGFWPDDVMTRNVGEALALVHSEITEAWDAAQTGTADDKLPEFPGVAVELADAAIRLLDLGGAYGVEFSVVDELTSNNSPDPYAAISEDLCELHAHVDAALEHHRKNRIEDFKMSVAMALGYTLAVMGKYGFDEEIIIEKVEFNKGRPYKHGKSY